MDHTFIEFIKPLLVDYGYLVSFLGGLFAGEEVVMTLAFLAANGFISIWVVLIFCFIGMFLCDIFFYGLGKLKYIQDLRRFERVHKISRKIDSFVRKLSKDSPFRALLYTKFIFGTRLITLIYLGFRKTPFKLFFISDFLVGLLWIAIVVSLGWFAGSSFKFILETFKNVQFALLFIVAFILAAWGIKVWIGKIIIKKQKQLI